MTCHFMNSPVFNKAATALCEYGRVLYERDWSPATSSNYSMRLDRDFCALTASGKHKGQLTPQDILVVNWRGEPQTAGKPSAETLLHTQLYRRDDRVGAVLHTHSLNAVLLSHVCKEGEVRLTGWELQKAFKSQQGHEDTLVIPVLDNDQDIPRLAKAVEQRMDQAVQPCHAYLIRGHGVYTWGESLGTCFRHLEALEHLFRYQLELIRLGHSGAQG